MNKQDKSKIQTQVLSLRALSSQYIEVIIKITNKNQFDFKAGQYLNLLVSNKEYPFSIATNPIDFHKDSKIHLHIKTSNEIRHKKNNEILEHLENNVNKDIYITGPYGKAYLRESSQNVDKPILLIAGGGGYSPINGILKYLIEIKSPIKIHLFWGAGILEHLYNHDYLLELDKKHDNFSYTPVLNNLENNNTQDLWKGENGLVIDSVIKKYPDLKNYIIHMAGPVPMCIDAKNKLLNANLDINNLYCDVLDLI